MLKEKAGNVAGQIWTALNGTDGLTHKQIKKATCGDQNNEDLYGKQMAGKALCLPRTIGSTTGGLVLYCACSMKRQPACMLFSEPVDSLAGAGAILADVWLDDVTMPVVDSLGEEFLEYVKDGMSVTVKENGVVEVEGSRDIPSR